LCAFRVLASFEKVSYGEQKIGVPALTPTNRVVRRLLASLACPYEFPKVDVRIFKTLVVFLVFGKFDLVKAQADFKTK
jgi:hypothetical protein